ncbi:hypothetical protein LSH36_13g00014 [Paralvinella palmiformis]|uniref:Uncharacterized protein n=1 Tax=Paralvinella palmiformis TaxID=53620 RepID=A0AAD9KC07_9ANNE|nr:hypothetical protein LSH36_13g00014 [Paralvinella palmiformis]
MILGFIAEKNLHFTDVPDLVELIKTLAKDGEALFQMFNRGKGPKATCKHIAALTYALDDFVREFVRKENEESLTEQLQRWNQPRPTKIPSVPEYEMHFEKKKMNRQTHEISGWHISRYSLNNSCDCDNIAVSELLNDLQNYEISGKKQVGLLKVVPPNQVIATDWIFAHHVCSVMPVLSLVLSQGYLHWQKDGTRDQSNSDPNWIGDPQGDGEASLKSTITWVRSKLRDAKKQAKNKDKEIKELKEEKGSIISKLQEKLDSAEKRVRKEQKMKSYYKVCSLPHNTYYSNETRQLKFDLILAKSRVSEIEDLLVKQRDSVGPVPLHEDNAFTDGDVLPLGFRRVAKEDATSITNNTKLELQEICDIHKEVQVEGQTVVDKDFMLVLVDKLSFVMSDRAANEKKSFHQINKWVQQELNRANLPPTIVAENVPVRMVRMASELLGPNGDEKCGIRGKWIADCRTRHVMSVIGDYRDNRFNGLFQVSAQLIHHMDDILSLEKKLKADINLKVKSLFLDLKDSRGVMMLQAHDIAYLTVTEPCWRLTLSKYTKYLELFRHIQPFYMNLVHYTDHPEDLLHTDTSSIPEFPPNRQHPLYATAMTIRHPDRQDILLQTLSKLTVGFVQTIRNQLTDFLEGGKFPAPSSDEALRRTAGSGVDNLARERNFGSLDASQKRHRHATLHYHSTILMLKHNRGELQKWLELMPARRRTYLWDKAKKHGKWLREKHRRDAAVQKHLKEKQLEDDEAAKKRKWVKQIVKKAKAAKLQCVKAKGQQKINRRAGKKNTRKSRRKGGINKEDIDVPLPDIELEMKVDKWVAVAFENGWFPGKIYETLLSKYAHCNVII